MRYILLVSLLASLFLSPMAWAMGMRAFVALPVEKGGAVGRLQFIHNDDTDTETGVVNLAYGISGKQTLLLGMPYRFSPGGANRSGEFSALYRHTLWQDDHAQGTRRFALLGGVLLPTTDNSSERLQAGAVATFYSGRSEVDMDLLWQDGRGISKDTARYDLAYQYRLSPARYPKWDEASEWDMDIELGGRYSEGTGTTRQLTTGLQWIHRSWVLEAGLIKDLNNNKDKQALFSLRVHF